MSKTVTQKQAIVLYRYYRGILAGKDELEAARYAMYTVVYGEVCKEVGYKYIRSFGFNQITMVNGTVISCKNGYSVGDRIVDPDTFQTFLKDVDEPTIETIIGCASNAIEANGEALQFDAFMSALRREGIHVN